MSDKLLVMTWLWDQNPPRHEYSAEKINKWAAQIRGNLTIPHRLACVTNIPKGLDSDIEVIKPPGFFENVAIDTWKEKQGAPQCYRRLALWHPEAADIFGAEWIVQMDADMIALQSLDPVFSRRDADVRIFNGTAAKRPYNGGLVMIKAGSRPKVWQRFSQDPAGIARAARKLYVGSDQAVISMLLGHGEKVFTEKDGIFYHSPRVIRQHGGMGRPPANMRILFFPGEVKPWNDKVKHQWMRDAWLGKRPLTFGPGLSRVPAPRVKIRAYRDPKGWGTEIAKAAAKAGVFCSTFTRPSMVQGGVAFVRLDQQGAQREISKGIVAELSRRGIMTLPTAQEAEWYDDKGAQLAALGRWMPKTIYATNREDANAAMATAGLTFPFVSKSIDGAGSKGVRMVNNERDAAREIEGAFSHGGIPSVYERRQRGYVYWQEFVPNNPCDYRVCIVGQFVYGLVRNTRPGDFRASGSGSNYPLTLRDERERAAARLCVEIAKAIDTNWMAFDVVFNADNKPLVLEMSSAWTMSAYVKCPMFNRVGLTPTRRIAAESWALAIDVMKAMWAKHVAHMQESGAYIPEKTEKVANG